MTLFTSLYTDSNQICNLCEDGRLSPVQPSVCLLLNSGSNCVYRHTLSLLSQYAQSQTALRQVHVGGHPNSSSGSASQRQMRWIQPHGHHVVGSRELGPHATLHTGSIQPLLSPRIKAFAMALPSSEISVLCNSQLSWGIRPALNLKGWGWILAYRGWHVSIYGSSCINSSLVSCRHSLESWPWFERNTATQLWFVYSALWRKKGYFFHGYWYDFYILSIFFFP